MENVLQEINRRYISLPDEDVRRNTKILEEVLDMFIKKMKTKDPLFNAMFRRVFYGGSYYDGLRVGKPEEFDLDILLDIPKYAGPVLTESDLSGYVHLEVRTFDAWMRQPEAMPAYRTFRNLFDDFFLSTESTLAWMEGIVQRTLNDFPYHDRIYTILEDHYLGTFRTMFTKSGPALTLHIYGPEMKMDVDLVACFVFREDKWPINSFKSNPFPSTKPEFFIVPKPLKKDTYQTRWRHWRLSFQEQERALLNNKERLKPTIKLLKKMRDNLQHNCIASYYIKTVLLDIVAQKEDIFWKMSLSHVFMTVLREYKEFIQNGNIPYYWNQNNNLIGNISRDILQNFSDRLARVIKDIETNPDKRATLANCLLTREERTDFLSESEFARFDSSNDNKMLYNFTNMDDVLDDINKRYIAFSKLEETRNVFILIFIEDEIIKHMKKVDPLFEAIFNRTFYGGSWYDDLKIGKPNEFDLDLLLYIENLAKIALPESNIPGFIHLKVIEFNEGFRYTEALKKLKTLCNKDGYIYTEDIVRWMYSVVQRAINCFDLDDLGFDRILRTPWGRYKITFIRNGPAMRLQILSIGYNFFCDDPLDIRNRNKVMTIDLVPCFYFKQDKWPQYTVIKNPVPEIDEFFIVPEAPKSSIVQPLDRYWRLSFQEHESKLIANKQNLKPTVKLLKKLRNTYEHKCITDYHIKTVVMHVAKYEDDTFWQKPLSYVFMTVLRVYKEFIRSKKIEFYWNKKHNLIDQPNHETLINIANFLERMIKDIERNPNKPEKVAEYLLPLSTYEDFLKKNLVQDESSGCLVS